MKILHIVAGNLNGGAAKGAYCLHKGLISKGVDSKILINGKLDNKVDSTIVSLSQDNVSRIKSIFRSQVEINILKLFKNRLGHSFSLGLMGYDFTKTNQYKEADVINLHWINNGLVNIKHLAKVEKPIVWTLRDMWPFTGGCHYSLDCVKYKYGCGACPQLGSKKQKDLSYFVYKRKLKYLPKNLTAVGISHWLTEQAKQSLIFKNHKCITISNNIDADKFQMIPKSIARQILGINTNKKIVLCGANNLNSFYKGFQKIVDALEYLDKKKIMLAFFGNVNTELLDSLGFEYKSFGYLYDDISLNTVYAAADLFVAPSIQEAFGKTLAEAQCSGTPVVCFDSTGPKDLVDHKLTGYLAKPFDALDLANGINWILDSQNYDDLCVNANQKVLQEFDSNVIAERYIELYKSVLNK